MKALYFYKMLLIQRRPFLRLPVSVEYVSTEWGGNGVFKYSIVKHTGFGIN